MTSEIERQEEFAAGGWEGLREWPERLYVILVWDPLRGVRILATSQ